MRITRTGFLLFSLFTFGFSASAQDNVSWDSSGNSMLSGTYNFRQVAWFLADNFGDIGEAVTLYGNITFNGQRDSAGNGAYTLTASVFDSSVGVLQQINRSGSYRIAASGLGFLSNPVFTSGGQVWGTVSQGGIFIGSSTEDGVNEMFVAAKVPSPVFNTTNFNGSYTIAEMDFPSLNVGQARDAMFQINPDGAGHLGALNVSGYIGNLDTNVLQSVGSATYSFNGNGLGTLNFGGTLTSANLVAGSRIFYMSPDKRFIFGGSVSGFDLFVGVLAPATTTADPNLLSGLYYQAGVDEDFTNLNVGVSNLSSQFGAFQATSGTLIGHERLLTGFNGIPAQFTAFDFTYSDSVSVNSDGTMDDKFGQHHVVAAGGDIRVGIGTGFHPGINVALRAPTFSGSGVFLNPTGAVNWFSSAPFTVGVSPGAFVALTGSGLSNVNLTDGSFPTSLGNVRVVVNDRSAPIYSVSPNMIIIVVPYATSGTAAQIQVLNNGVGSSPITVFATTTTPGVLAANGGAGHAIAQHLDFSLVTSSNPAKPGEIILFYAEGLGSVSPAVADGAQAPLSPLSPVVAPFNAFIDGEQTNILFAGLTPTLVADYAFIITIPADTLPGDRSVEITSIDSDTAEATVPVGGTAPSASLSDADTPAPLAPVAPKPLIGKLAGTVPDTLHMTEGPLVETPWGGMVPANPTGR